MQRHLYEYFQLPGHADFLQDAYITLIDKTPLSLKAIGFIPIKQSYLWGIVLKVVTELLSYIVIEQLFIFTGFGRLVLGLLADYLD